MSVKPSQTKTVDNLGVESSIRYAQDKQFLDPTIIQDSKWVPQKAETTATKPSTLSEFDERFSLTKTTQWALFSPPPNYQVKQRALFSYQVIPSLGTPEKQEEEMEKLTAMGDALDGEGKNQGEHSDQDEEEKEKRIVAALLACIGKLDRTLSLINARRNQYQRG